MKVSRENQGIAQDGWLHKQIFGSNTSSWSRSLNRASIISDTVLSILDTVHSMFGLPNYFKELFITNSFSLVIRNEQSNNSRARNDWFSY